MSYFYTIPWARTALVAVTLVLLGSCRFIQIDTHSDQPITYQSKTIEYSAYIDPQGIQLEPVETFVYDGDGKFEAKFVNHYREFTPGEAWVLGRTDVYTLDDHGKEYLQQYYEYDYLLDSYAAFDEEGNGYTATTILISEGRSYKPSAAGYNTPGTLYHKYLVQYPDRSLGGPFPNEPRRYAEISDYVYAADGTAQLIARQTSTYKQVAVNGKETYWDYATEKFYQSPQLTPGVWDGAPELVKEFVAWYDGAGFWTHELYHTVRTSDAANASVNLVYLTKYEWNDLGQVYKQQDYLYLDPALPVLADGSFDGDVLTADNTIKYDFLGSLDEEVSFAFDDLGNIIDRRAWYKGQEVDRKVYRFNGSSEQTSMVQYTNGQSYPFARVETRYSDGIRKGQYARIREELRYQNDLTSRSFGSSAVSLQGPLNYRVASTAHKFYRQIRSNHER
jgi:hypothetical protein